MLLLENRLARYTVRRRRLRAALESMTRALRLRPGTAISLALCSVTALSKLGERHFGRSEPTDVIAFPTGFPEIGGMLGELWIAPDTVARNGEEYGKGLNGEFLFVLAHGLLHLIGEEDDTPARRQAMFDRQEKLLAACRGREGALPVVIQRARGRSRAP